MPKIWVEIQYPTNPHPVDPSAAYRAIVEAVAGKQGFVDEMLFDEYEENSRQYLLITIPTEDSFAGVVGALHDFNPHGELRLRTLGELSPPSSSA